MIRKRLLADHSVRVEVNFSRQRYGLGSGGFLKLFQKKSKLVNTLTLHALENALQFKTRSMPVLRPEWVTFFGKGLTPENLYLCRSCRCHNRIRCNCTKHCARKPRLHKQMRMTIWTKRLRMPQTVKHSYFTQGCEAGSSGSLSLRGTSINVGEGLRCSIFDGVNGIDTMASVIDGETKGTETENQISDGVDSRRNFGDVFFEFGKSGLFFGSLTKAAGATKQDSFAGAGPA